MTAARLRWTLAVLVALLCTTWPVTARQGTGALSPPGIQVEAGSDRSRDDAGSESDEGLSRTMVFGLIIGGFVVADGLVLFWFLRRRAEAQR